MLSSLSQSHVMWYFIVLAKVVVTLIVTIFHLADTFAITTSRMI